MYAPQNFDLYINDHPEFESYRHRIMARVREATDERGMVPGSIAEEVFGDKAQDFISDVIALQKHWRPKGSEPKAVAA